MPKDLRLVSKKRHHPDGFLLSSSASKKVSFISEAGADSSIDSARNSTIISERLSDSAHGSFCNSVSAVVTSDRRASAFDSHSPPTSANIVSFKHPHLGHIHRQDKASHGMEPSQIGRRPPIESNQKELWMNRAPGPKFEDSTTNSEFSEVTCAGASVTEQESKGGSASGKATHIISRREKSSLNTKWDMDAAWVKDSFGSAAMLRQKQQESTSAFLSGSERRGLRSMATESDSSCGTKDSIMKEIRPKQGFSHTYGPVLKESFTKPTNAHMRVDLLVGLRAVQETSGRFGYLNTRHSSTVVESNPSFLIKGKGDDISPSYVLSSGRLSLEEEARKGQRVSTIDHDFEEYFSSLMLE